MRILLADDHKMLCDGLRTLLEREHFSVVGEAATGHEAIAMAHRLRPDVVVMDLSMPELNGIEATRRLVKELPTIKVLGLSMNTDRRYATAMFEAGAAGYLPKNCAADELVKAVRTVADGHAYMSPTMAADVDRSRPSVKTEGNTERSLSPREREVLQLLAEGLGSKEIAARLDVAVPTVESHRRQIMGKLKLHTTAELTKYAIREGLTTLE